ncbi:PREDICTED: adaptin ear-binding coat-associated protein 1-like [Priapulus caudatus]|uniref:Adaptin ear-binding coat-associated protein 1-like n=1 Tax=Priapulus caudatus TaxID=37621 RepID=A0ABM1FBU6_PRICU|nr:PREDICTED: adaptin ear-binding coat-associated protein 1-like [Priapulus caudatus]
MAEYERVLLVKPEVFVYKIPPRQSNRGYKAADWSLQAPDWTGRLRVVTRQQLCYIKLEDKSGELFAQCPIDAYPGVAVEPVMDSSRYFVIRIQDESGRNAFIGVGFADRSDSFDLNVSLQDHFKSEQKSVELEQQQQQPALDLAFKEGQTISINIGNKPKMARPKPAGSSGGIGMLPPPPGSKIPTLAPPPSSLNPVRGRGSPVRVPAAQSGPISSTNTQPSSTVNCFLDLEFGGPPAATNVPAATAVSAVPETIDWLQF